jgi:purine-binding chemotaxis protein CheW
MTSTSQPQPVKPTDVNDGILVTMFVGEQMFGIPVMQVQDILGPQRITRVPLAPPEVMGSLNLRGRIVTAIDLRTRLAMPRKSSDVPGMNVVVEFKGELFSLLVDRVGEVITLQVADFEKNPPTLDAHWREVSNGVYRLKDNLLVVLDVTRLLALDLSVAA